MSGPNPAAQVLAEDRIELRSVGVDIGSATTHLLFSRLTLQKVGSRYVTVGREIVYESPIMLTPYTGLLSIDGDALREFIDAQYELTRVTREEIDTGALILTGVALLRENARTIADIFAAEAGRFVAVSAGDNLEAIMAAYGSGAVASSEAPGARVLNVDIGGGTTKLAVCVGGRIEQVLAMDVGARLVVTDDAYVVNRLEPAGREVAAALGIPIEVGTTVTEAQLAAIARFMVDQIIATIPTGDEPHELPKLLRGEPLRCEPAVTGVVFSGGVSEYVYGREPLRFGDLGVLLAAELRTALQSLAVPTLPGGSGIRATVVGASQYTAQVSGSTIYLSSADVVPVRNVPVVAPLFDMSDVIDENAVALTVEDAIARFDLLDQPGPVALAIRWKGMATFGRLHSLARGIERGLLARTDSHAPVVIVCDDDIGRLIGKHLVEEIDSGRPTISIDCVVLNDFDFIDVGGVISGSNVVPVVIKSLMFPEAKDPAFAETT